MATPSARLYFDFVDPLSYVVSRLAAGSPGGAQETLVEWIGFELRPPPLPLAAPDDPVWADRWTEARRRARGLGLRLAPPRLVPWSRKAHELHLHAAGHGRQGPVRSAVFEAYFGHGRDIGRVDVLVDIAAATGLDRNGTKAVLDVDRHEADVASARRAAQEAGVTDVPCLRIDGRRVEGFPDLAHLGTLLPDS